MIPACNHNRDALARAPENYQWIPLLQVLSAQSRMPRQWSLLGSHDSQVPIVLLSVSMILGALIVIFPLNYYVHFVLRDNPIGDLFARPRGGFMFLVLVSLCIGLCLYGLSYAVWRIIVKMRGR